MLKRSVGVCLFFFGQAALAQPAPAAKPVAPAAAPAKPVPGAAARAAAPPAAAAAAAPAVAAEPQPVTEPVLPQVTDDMLAPVPPATNVLQNWRDALRLLRDNNSTLRTAKAQEDVSTAIARQALAPALPSLTANGSVTRQLLKGEAQVLDFPGTLNALRANPNADPVYGTVTLPGNATTWQAGLNLRIPLLNLAAWHNRGTALDQIEVSKLNTKAAERFNIALVADAVVTTVTAERLAEVSRISLESALSTLDLSKRRAALGAASTIDVLRIEQEVSLSRAQVVSANDGVLRAREQLGSTLGSSEAYGVTPSIRLDELANDAKSTCRPADVLTRSDVRAAEAQINVSKRNEEGVSKTYWPTVDAVSSLTYWSPVSGINNEHVTWSVGGVLNWTLYDGGLRYATKSQRSAETRIAAEQLYETKRKAQLEVTQAIRTVKSSEATLAVAAKTREIAAETARLTKVSYINGSATSFDLVDTARRLREAEVDYTIKEFNVLRAKIAALLALATCDV